MKKIKKKVTKKPQDIIYGIHPIIELLRAKKRHVQIIYTTKPVPKNFKQIERLISPRTTVKFVTREQLERLTGTKDHQSVAALTTALILRKKPFDPQKQPFIVMVDSVQDTRNLGGILRSVHCTGAFGAVIPEKNGAPLTGATNKASAGLVEHLEIYRPSNSHIALQEIKEAGYSIYLAALGGKSSLEITYTKPLCIVIGNESTGISRDLLKMGQAVTLPQKTPEISYNASVAAGILLFTIATQIGALK